MEPQVSDPRPNYSKLLLPLLLIIVIAAAGGWWLGNKNRSQEDKQQPSGISSKGGTVTSLINYSLPAGWTDTTCPSAPNDVYIATPEISVNCGPPPSKPASISVQAQGATDCSQLANEQNVQKHICKSIFIGGHKTLQSYTEYPSSSTKAAYAVDTYYMDTGKGIVKAEYTHTPDQISSDFNQFIQSFKVR